MFGFQQNQRNLRPKKEPRGTVLILCVALLVILGLVASSFVILSHSERASSRALSRADQLEQVRQMSLEYVRTLLLEDLVGDDGIFLNADPGDADEAYDAPGADAWLASREPTGLAGEEAWPYISNVFASNQALYRNVAIDTPGLVNTDGDAADVGDARWIPASSNLPFANVTAQDGTRYRVAIRIVDTNGLANINVGAANIDASWSEQN